MNKSALILLVILALLSLFFILSGQNKIIVLLKNYSSDILRPIMAIISEFGKKLFFWQDALLNAKQIKESNTRLISENLDLFSELSTLVALEEENALLRINLNLKKKSINVLLANIIGRDLGNNRSFIIDKGSDDGVAAGMTIITKDEIIIGRIADANRNTAKVQTLLDANSRIAATTANSKISGLVRGLGSDAIFDLIAKNKTPETGELIISSGTDGIWPRGFILGKIREIKSYDNQVFDTASIELLSPPQSFNSIFIILQ